MHGRIRFSSSPLTRDVSNASTANPVLPNAMNDPRLADLLVPAKVQLHSEGKEAKAKAFDGRRSSGLRLPLADFDYTRSFTESSDMFNRYNEAFGGVAESRRLSSQKAQMQRTSGELEVLFAAVEARLRQYERQAHDFATQSRMETGCSWYLHVKDLTAWPTAELYSMFGDPRTVRYRSLMGCGHRPMPPCNSVGFITYMQRIIPLAARAKYEGLETRGIKFMENIELLLKYATRCVQLGDGRPEDPLQLWVLVKAYIPRFSCTRVRGLHLPELHQFIDNRIHECIQHFDTTRREVRLESGDVVPVRNSYNFKAVFMILWDSYFKVTLDRDLLLHGHWYRTWSYDMLKFLHDKTCQEIRANVEDLLLLPCVPSLPAELVEKIYERTMEAEQLLLTLSHEECLSSKYNREVFDQLKGGAMNFIDRDCFLSTLHCAGIGYGMEGRYSLDLSSVIDDEYSWPLEDLIQET